MIVSQLQVWFHYLFGSCISVLRFPVGTQPIAPFSVGLSLRVSYPFLWLISSVTSQSSCPKFSINFVFCFQLPPGYFHCPYFLPLPKLNILLFLPRPLIQGFSVPLKHCSSFPLTLKTWSWATFPSPLSPPFIRSSGIFCFLRVLSLPFSLFDTTLICVFIVRGHVAALHSWVQAAGQHDKRGLTVWGALCH